MISSSHFFCGYPRGRAAYRPVAVASHVVALLDHLFSVALQACLPGSIVSASGASSIQES